jgi:hypothetical protein
MGIGDVAFGGSGAAPLAQPGLEHGFTGTLRAFADAGKMNPRHVRVLVVALVPVVVEPKGVEPAERAEVAGAFVHVALGVVVVHVLHGRPAHAEGADEAQPTGPRDESGGDESAVEDEQRDGFDADEAVVAGVERFQQRLGGAVEVGGGCGPEARAKGKDEIADRDAEPETAGQDVVEGPVFPEAAVAFEVVVEGFVVGAVADVVAEVTLAKEVKRCGEKEREDGADGVVEGAVGVEQAVLRFVQHQVGGVHHEGVGQGEEGCPWPEREVAGGEQQADQQEELTGGDEQVEP